MANIHETPPVPITQTILFTEHLILPPNLVEVTPDNIKRLDFSNLHWNPYFSGEHPFGTVYDLPELKPNEFLEILIPSEAIQARVDAATLAIARTVFQNSREFTFGAVTKGGLWLYDRLLSKLADYSPWGLKSINSGAHIDVKSRYGTETGEYEIRELPKPEMVNGKTLYLCEGVADTVQTLQIIEDALSSPPYEGVDLRVLLLLDKIKAHPGKNLPKSVEKTLFYSGNVWVSGCGPDTDQRFRDLNCVVVYKKANFPEVEK